MIKYKKIVILTIIIINASCNIGIYDEKNNDIITEDKIHDNIAVDLTVNELHCVSKSSDKHIRYGDDNIIVFKFFESKREKNTIGIWGDISNLISDGWFIQHVTTFTGDAYYGHHMVIIMVKR